LLFEEAIRSYKIALEIDISFLPASLNMGKALEKIGKYKYALNIYDQAQVIHPKNSEIYLNRGELNTNLNNYDEAIFDFNKVNEINSNKNDGDYNIALLNLKFRKFENVWGLYDLRWQTKQTYLNTKKPELKKLPSTFKKLFIWSEQGIGDHIFFSNIIHNFAPFFELIIISIDHRMVTLYQRSLIQYKNIKVMSSKNILNENDYDVQIPLGSIGRFFIKNKTDINSNVKPFLKSDSNQTKIIKRNLKKGNKIICGLSWKTKSQENGFNRSINLDTLMPILQLNNFIFVNLQYGDSNEELNKLEKNYNIKNYNSIDNFNELDSFVSLIDACDVVISIDNSCIHFAGALNKRAYLLLPYAIGTHWYWGTNQIKSEWYPSVKIIRQENPNDWESIIFKLKKDIS
jgi:tetratricopeptide (TPR) repeat protein